MGQGRYKHTEFPWYEPISAMQALQFWVEELQSSSDNFLSGAALMVRPKKNKKKFHRVDVTEDNPSNIVDGTWVEFQLWSIEDSHSGSENS